MLKFLAGGTFREARGLAMEMNAAYEAQSRAQVAAPPPAVPHSPNRP